MLLQVSGPDRFRPLRHHLRPVQHPLRHTVKTAGLDPLHDGGPLRPGCLRDRRVVDPLIVVAGAVEVARPHEPPRGMAYGLRGGGHGGLAVRHLAEHGAAVSERQSLEWHRPEGGQAPEGDEDEQPDDHRDRDRQRCGGQPDPRLAVGGQRGVA